jgi:predicted transporter
LKYGLVNGVSAALFAAGFYTNRRWNIHTASHGVLIIARVC